MNQDVLEADGLNYEPCRYGLSRIFFRGPKRRLDEPYLAFVGGTETFGKFIEQPLPTLTEKGLRRPCVNFGCVNGGIDAFVNDPTIMDICRDADLNVVQIMGAQNLSNRFYAVHPRRNDRFVRASSILQALYGEVDFSAYTFNRHLLNALHEMSVDRFELVVGELKQAWTARMRSMLERIGKRTVLLWFSREPLSNVAWYERDDPIGVDPLFVTEDMVLGLEDLVMDLVVVKPTENALAEGTYGMRFPPMQARAAADMLSIGAHREAAAVLVPRLNAALQLAGRL